MALTYIAGLIHFTTHPDEAWQRVCCTLNYPKPSHHGNHEQRCYWSSTVLQQSVKLGKCKPYKCKCGKSACLEDPEEQHLITQAFFHEACQGRAAPVCCPRHGPALVALPPPCLIPPHNLLRAPATVPAVSGITYLRPLSHTLCGKTICWPTMASAASGISVFRKPASSVQAG